MRKHMPDAHVDNIFSYLEHLRWESEVCQGSVKPVIDILIFQQSLIWLTTSSTEHVHLGFCLQLHLLNVQSDKSLFFIYVKHFYDSVEILYKE